ncbi:MAG TPA: hypothetical protein VKB19_18750 [Pedobacter sp.]|nr:hypothetical protein [Pedobacter sp.]
MKGLDITEGLAESAWESMNKAIDSRDSSTVYEFISFFRDILRDSIAHNKIKYFKEFIAFPSRMYSRIAHKHKSSSSYQSLVNEISTELSLHLKEIIDFYIGLMGKTHIGNQDIDAYYYEAFDTFNRLLYFQILNQDWLMLKGSLKRYGHLSQDVFSHSTRDEIRLREMETDNPNGIHTAQIGRIRSEIQAAAAFDRYKRQPIAAIKYWFMLLFEQDVIEQGILAELLKATENIGGYDPNKEIEDILFFRTADLRSYMGWERWDYKERPESEVYYPPMPVNWMTRGFVIDRIRTNNAYFNTSQVSPELMENMPYFYDAVVQDIEGLRQDFEKWKRVLRLEDLEDFNLRAAGLLGSIALAKRSVIGVREQAIAAAALDPGLILEFKAKMGAAWLAQTRIRRVFSYFGNILDVSGEDILLKRIGQNTFLAKGKIMFIDGEYGSPIYGMEQLGGSVGKWEDNLFMEVIGQADPVVLQGKTMLETLNECIAQLRESGTEPTMVFLEPQYMYKDDAFLSSELYASHYDLALNPDNIAFFVVGTFDGIPLFSSYSLRLKNKVVVSDFAAAFRMLHKTDDSWFKRELAVNVLLVSEELVNQKYLNEPDKWRITDAGIQLSEQDAKILIRTSIVLDLETIADFQVLDHGKFVIGQISEPLSD